MGSERLSYLPGDADGKVEELGFEPGQGGAEAPGNRSPQTCLSICCPGLFGQAGWRGFLGGLPCSIPRWTRLRTLQGPQGALTLAGCGSLLSGCQVLHTRGAIPSATLLHPGCSRGWQLGLMVMFVLNLTVFVAGKRFKEKGR